jgi:hypothetical protein
VQLSALEGKQEGMTENFFQELTIWGENGERDLLLLVKNVMKVEMVFITNSTTFFISTIIFL